MTTPAQRHFQKVMAEKESAKAADSNIRPDANQYELMMAQLYEHTRQLKAIESIKAKGELKATLLPVYGPYIDGVLASDAGIQDDVVMTVLVWSIDAQDWDGALEIAEYALKHNMELPDKYQRSTVCVITEQIAEAAKVADTVPLAILQRTGQLIDGQDMPDQVRAKFHKALGLTLEASEPQASLNNLRLALSFDEKAGVKKDIDRLERAVKKQAPVPDNGAEA